MFKKIFFWGMLAAILASIAGITYNRIYFFTTETDFSAILNIKSILSLNVAVCLIACFLYWAFVSRLKKNGEIIFNLLFSVLSFALVIVPISISLPLNIKNPELFPGLAVPMVFFPSLSWYTIRPLFKINN